MPTISMTIPHQLSEDEALRRIKTLLDQVKSENPGKFSDLHESWSGNRGAFSAAVMGFDVSGRIAVTPSQVELELDVPFAAFPFKASIEETIRQQAERVLS